MVDPLKVWLDAFVFGASSGMLVGFLFGVSVASRILSKIFTKPRKEHVG